MGAGGGLNVGGGSLTLTSSVVTGNQAVGGIGGNGGPPPPPPTIIGELVLTSQKLNKHKKPVGKPVITGFEIQYSTAMNQATAGSPGNYQVDWISTKRVKKKPTQILHPLAITVDYNAATDSVDLMLAGKQAFADGGQITVVATPPGGVGISAGVSSRWKQQGSRRRQRRFHDPQESPQHHSHMIIVALRSAKRSMTKLAFRSAKVRSACIVVPAQPNKNRAFPCVFHSPY